MQNEKIKMVKNEIVKAMNDAGCEVINQGKYVTCRKNGKMKTYDPEFHANNFAESLNVLKLVYTEVLIDIVAEFDCESIVLMPHLITEDELDGIGDNILVEKLDDGRFVLYKDEFNIGEKAFFTKELSVKLENYKSIAFDNLEKNLINHFFVKEYDGFDHVEIINELINVDPRTALLSSKINKVFDVIFNGRTSIVTSSRGHLFAFNLEDDYQSIIFDIMYSKRCQYCERLDYYEYENHNLVHIFSIAPTFTKKKPDITI